VNRPVEQLVDEILVMDCQSGSVKAMELLVSRWQKRLWRYAYKLGIAEFVLPCVGLSQGFFLPNEQ